MKKVLTKPVKAYKNASWLNSRHARPIRILSEFFEPLSRFNQFGIHSTVVFFGSARIKSKNEVLKIINGTKNNFTKKLITQSKYNNLQEQNKSLLELSKYYEDATELSRLLTEWTETLPLEKRIYVCSGGGPGIMEAANKGAKLANGKSIGLNISLEFEQDSNEFISPDLNFEFHYFFMRKYWFMYLGKALIAFPGGFGTIDEMMELLTLSQTSKIKKKITVLLYGKEYWEKIINFKELARLELISKKDLSLFSFVNSPKEAFIKLKTDLIKNYPEYFASNE